MKVLCIDDKNRNGSQNPDLKYGETYESIREVLSASGRECYEIAGLEPTYTPFGKRNEGAYYLKSRFIPLSDISETEMEREYNLQTQSA